MPSTDATAVLIVVPINHVVATLDHPMPAVDLQHALRVGLFRGAAGEAVRDLQRTLATLFLRAVSLDDERLAHMRKVEITVEFAGGPDLARFDAPVIRRGMLDELRLATIPEVEFQIFKNSRLVAFDGEIVMRLALPHHVFGQLTLRQHGIRTDVFALHLDGIEQRDGHLDLVRAFEFVPLVIRYGQGANFFCV